MGQFADRAEDPNRSRNAAAKDGPERGPADDPEHGTEHGPTDDPTDGPKDGPKDGPTDGPKDSPKDGPKDSDKRSLRREILAVRNRLPEDVVRGAAVLLAERALGLPELARARTVAAYVSVGAEPGTLALLDALRARGVRVLLPALLPDNDLDWGAYEGEASLARVRHGGKMALLEPSGPRLGPEAVAAADAVLLPGLAVDARGMRLGRGGGSYDRVLARLRRAQAGPALVVLLYDTEVVERVPAEEHDLPVHAVVTPSGVRRF